MFSLQNLLTTKLQNYKTTKKSRMSDNAEHLAAEQLPKNTHKTCQQLLTLKLKQ